jgi:hypothetical protein
MGTGLSMAGECFIFLKDGKGTGILLAGMLVIMRAGKGTGLSIASECLTLFGREDRYWYFIGRLTTDQGGRHADWAFNGWLMLCFSRIRERDRHLISR